MTQDNTEPLTLSIREFAKEQRIGVSTAYEGARTGDIPTIKIGKRILVSMPAYNKKLIEAGE